MGGSGDFRCLSTKALPKKKKKKTIFTLYTSKALKHLFLCQIEKKCIVVPLFMPVSLVFFGGGVVFFLKDFV